MERLTAFLYSLVSDPRAVFAAIAIVVSVISFTYTLMDRSRVRIDAILDGLRGDNASVTYTALRIRLTKLLSKRRYRRSLISALLLAWNFEDSDRARASILLALLEAKEKYRVTYDEVIADLNRQFNIYGAAKGEEGIKKRGVSRLEDVLLAIERAERHIKAGEQAPKEIPPGSSEPQPKQD